MTLKEALDYAKLSQVELAEKLGTTKQQISIWASGKHKPRAATQRKIDDILGVKVNY